jgi:hypothetical protein
VFLLRLSPAAEGGWVRLMLPRRVALALERMGLGVVTKGELTVRPGAHNYWQSRMAGPGGLREVPLLVAVAGVQCPTSVAEVCFEWVELTSTGCQLSFRASGRAAAADSG